MIDISALEADRLRDENANLNAACRMKQRENDQLRIIIADLCKAMAEFAAKGATIITRITEDDEA